MRYFVQTTIALSETDPIQNVAVQVCDDLEVIDDFVGVKVSARQFERIVGALRAGNVPHHIKTLAPAYLERSDGTITESTDSERKEKAFTVLHKPQGDVLLPVEGVAEAVGVSPKIGRAHV